MRAFTYETLPMRVVFGPGCCPELAGEVDRLGMQRVLVLCTPQQEHGARRIADILGHRAVSVFAGARVHVPIATAEAAGTAARAAGVDGCVAVGGGSTIGLGKALALRDSLPMVAVPTTYAGSEMTPIWGVTEDGVKRTGRNRKVLPRAVVYDPDLTHSLPVGSSVTSGLNAVAHAVEALYAPDLSPIPALMAEDGVRALVGALERIVRTPTDPDARTDALRGSWLCGAALGSTTMSLHHKLCHVLGGTFDLPHADVHAVLLPHVVAFNSPAAPEAMAALRRALGVDLHPASALWQLANRLGAPTNLATVGMPTEGVADVVRQVLMEPYANPRPVDGPDLTALLTRALHGDGPRPDRGPGT